MPEPLIIRARPPQSSVAFLEAEGLPASDLTEAHPQHFFFTGADGAPSALVGLEIYGEDALLRSLLVSAGARTQGFGSVLVRHAEGHAVAHRMHVLHLLTTTAESFFVHRGYRRIAIEPKRRPRSTPEVASLCPTSSAFMIKRL